MTGSEKASVLPEPVRARPMRSLPSRAGSNTCFWMGKSAVMPRASSALTVTSDSPQLDSCARGGGRPSAVADAHSCVTGGEAVQVTIEDNSSDCAVGQLRARHGPSAAVAVRTRTSRMCSRRACMRYRRRGDPEHCSGQRPRMHAFAFASDAARARARPAAATTSAHACPAAAATRARARAAGAAPGWRGCATSAGAAPLATRPPAPRPPPRRSPRRCRRCWPASGGRARGQSPPRAAPRRPPRQSPRPRAGRPPPPPPPRSAARGARVSVLHCAELRRAELPGPVR